MVEVNGEPRVAIPEPAFEDYEVAIRSLSGARLRPGDETRLESPAGEEAKQRVEHMMRSQVAAARASLAALGPNAIKCFAELLNPETHVKDEIRLGAIRLWLDKALPPEPVQVAHTHSLDQGDRQLVGDAAASFLRLTNELSERLTGHRTIDISASPHLLRGEAARPITTRLERRETEPVGR